VSIVIGEVLDGVVVVGDAVVGVDDVVSAVETG
jgi:hypothetical protein